MKNGQANSAAESPVRPAHTPGPWLVKAAREYRTVYVLRPADHTFVENPHICQVFLCDHEDTLDANARLIAAAPELLAACKEAVAMLATFGSATYTTRENVKAAINKAEGR